MSIQTPNINASESACKNINAGVCRKWPAQQISPDLMEFALA